MGKPELFTIKQAAERLGITRATMWRRAKEWRLTDYRNPMDKRERLLDWEEVARAIEQHEHDTTRRNLTSALAAHGAGLDEIARLRATVGRLETRIGMISDARDEYYETWHKLSAELELERAAAKASIANQAHIIDGYKRWLSDALEKKVLYLDQIGE